MMKKILNGFGRIAMIIFIAIFLFSNSARCQTQADSLTVKKSLKLNGVAVKKISKDTALSENEDTVLATQKAVKKYVDNKASAADATTIKNYNNGADFTNITTTRTNLQAFGNSDLVVADVNTMMSYNGFANVITVSDSARGGVFNFKPAAYSLTVDSGVIFPSAKGGYFVRQLSNNEKIHVKWFGARGVYTDDYVYLQRAINFCFGDSIKPHGVNSINYELYFDKGYYEISKPLLFSKINGGIISGAGRSSTFIMPTTANSLSSLIKTNGCQFTKFSDFYLKSNADTTTVLFNLDWDGTSTFGVSLQSNSFNNINFEQGYTGLSIGTSSYMGSENLITNCFFVYNQFAGVSTNNYNALQNTVIGGNFQGCGYGVYVGAGSVNLYSVGFQLQKKYDIVVWNSGNDVMTVSGCRSESTNFIQLYNGVNAFISNNNHTSVLSGGYFLYGGSGCTIINCNSNFGLVDGAGNLTVKDSWFGRKKWIGSYYGNLTIQNVTAGKVPNSIIEGYQVGSNNTLLSNNLGLMASGYHFIADSGYIDRWFNGARGAFFQIPGDTLSKGNPITGYLIENDGRNIPRLRNQNNYNYLTIRTDSISFFLNDVGYIKSTDSSYLAKWTLNGNNFIKGVTNTISSIGNINKVGLGFLMNNKHKILIDTTGNIGFASGNIDLNTINSIPAPFAFFSSGTTSNTLEIISPTATTSSQIQYSYNNGGSLYGVSGYNSNGYFIFNAISNTIPFIINKTTGNIFLGNPSINTPTAKIHFSNTDSFANGSIIKFTLAGSKKLLIPEIGAFQPLKSSIIYVDSSLHERSIAFYDSLFTKAQVDSAIAANLGNATSGSYTFSTTAVTNVSSSAGGTAYYMKVGSVVNVSGIMTVTPTATGVTTVDLSLPFSTNFSATPSDCAGTATSTNSAIFNYGTISQDNIFKKAGLTFNAGTTSTTTFYFHYQYVVN